MKPREFARFVSAFSKGGAYVAALAAFLLAACGQSPSFNDVGTAAGDGSASASSSASTDSTTGKNPDGSAILTSPNVSYTVPSGRSV